MGGDKPLQDRMNYRSTQVDAERRDLRDEALGKPKQVFPLRLYKQWNCNSKLWKPPLVLSWNDDSSFVNEKWMLLLNVKLLRPSNMSECAKRVCLQCYQVPRKNWPMTLSQSQVQVPWLISYIVILFHEYFCWFWKNCFWFLLIYVHWVCLWCHKPLETRGLSEQRELRSWRQRRTLINQQVYIISCD